MGSENKLEEESRLEREQEKREQEEKRGRCPGPASHPATSQPDTEEAGKVGHTE